MITFFNYKDFRIEITYISSYKIENDTVCSLL